VLARAVFSPVCTSDARGARQLEAGVDEFGVALIGGVAPTVAAIRAQIQGEPLARIGESDGLLHVGHPRLRACRRLRSRAFTAKPSPSEVSERGRYVDQAPNYAELSAHLTCAPRAVAGRAAQIAGSGAVSMLRGASLCASDAAVTIGISRAVSAYHCGVRRLTRLQAMAVGQAMNLGTFGRHPRRSGPELPDEGRRPPRRTPQGARAQLGGARCSPAE
jgi:hypothetical protein